MYEGRTGWWHPEHGDVTDYEEQLAARALAGDDDEQYRHIKAEAHDAVDEFLAAHRSSEAPPGS